MTVREVRCPVCKKMVSLRGFSGHLRFTHKLSKKAASEITSKSKKKADLPLEVSSMGNYKRVLSLIDKLDGIRKRRMEVDSLSVDARAPVIRALWRAEEDVQEELVKFYKAE